MTRLGPEIIGALETRPTELSEAAIALVRRAIRQALTDDQARANKLRALLERALEARRKEHRGPSGSLVSHDVSVRPEE